MTKWGWAVALTLLARLAFGAEPCAAPEYRQFDFWLGAWQVTAPDGTLAGRNRIEKILGGCALQEHWTSAGGGGTSFNTFDARRGVWHQTWVDAGGTLLLLDGNLQADGRMVLRGEIVADGGPVLQEIAWQPLDDGTVRQLWRSSDDQGKTWRVVFDGIYRRAD